MGLKHRKGILMQKHAVERAEPKFVETSKCYLDQTWAVFSVFNGGSHVRRREMQIKTPIWGSRWRKQHQQTLPVRLLPLEQWHSLSRQCHAMQSHNEEGRKQNKHRVDWQVFLQFLKVSNTNTYDFSAFKSDVFPRFSTETSPFLVDVQFDQFLGHASIWSSRSRRWSSDAFHWPQKALLCWFCWQFQSGSCWIAKKELFQSWKSRKTCGKLLLASPAMISDSAKELKWLW